MVKIFFSSGHMANQPGAIVGDLNEYEIAYDITQKLEDHFKEDKRIEFRYGWPLAQKIDHINDQSDYYDLVIELHFNAAYREGACGTEVWYWSKKEEIFARIFQRNILELGGKDRGIKTGAYWRLIKGKKIWYTLAFLRRTIPMALILEPLFLTNLEDAAAIRRKSFRMILVSKLYHALIESCNLLEREAQ